VRVRDRGDRGNRDREHDATNGIGHAREKVVRDEAVAVDGRTALASQVLLEVGERAIGAEREEQADDRHGGDVRPGETGPPPGGVAAEDRERDERDVHDHHEVGSSYVQHVPLRA
jgi:hypothetical protein